MEKPGQMTTPKKATMTHCGEGEVRCVICNQRFFDAHGLSGNAEIKCPRSRCGWLICIVFGK